MAAISPFSDLASLAKALSSKAISVPELTRFFLSRIATDATNSFLAIDPETSLAKAAAAQKRLDSGDTGGQTSPGKGPGQGFSLVGLPIGHKDIFVTRDWPTTAASKILKGYRSPFDATIVEKLEQAGMVGMGKLNCDEFAMGSGNTHSAFGPVKNPWDIRAIPGGSSGGSAAAVAGGLIPAATGTDTGGSIRQPAAMCGLTGIKPTYGRASRWGMIAYASSLDQAGPIARTALDCAVLLGAMTGFDEKDSTSLEQPSEDFANGIDEPVREGGRPGMPLRL